MKYMTFNSSCSYAGVANLLELRGVDVTDRELALSMELPYLFAREEGGYCAGPMLQSARWFDLGLRPRGFCLEEEAVEAAEVFRRLTDGGPAMLGLRGLTRSGKHAVIFTGLRDGRCRFLNNRRADSAEPEELLLTRQELLDRLDGRTVLARLCPVPAEAVDMWPVLARSAAVLRELSGELNGFCGAQRTPAEQRQALDRLFRAILLDGITMLELLGEEKIRPRLTAVQRQLLTMVRAGETVCPAQALDLPVLTGAVEDYAALIQYRQAKLSKS